MMSRRTVRSDDEPFMGFRQLATLKRNLATLSRSHSSSLAVFSDTVTNGFAHRFDKRGKLSLASTATSVSSLVAAGLWKGDWANRTSELIERLLRGDWQSAELEKDNVFSTAFMLEVVTDLTPFDDRKAAVSNGDEIDRAEKILTDGLADGCVRIGEYPPSAYLTQLGYRVLRSRGKLGTQLGKKIRDWAWGELNRQVALLQAHSKAGDVFQLAYATILCAGLAEPSETTPDQTLLIQVAVRRVFEHQLPDGSFPRSQPLFHYPGAGSAYCYEYEMLVQLLQEPQLMTVLIDYLPQLRGAALALIPTAYRLPGQALAWSSGHNPQFRGPQSWATASAFHFAHALDRLLAEAIRQALFKFVDVPYVPPIGPKQTYSEFAPAFLDCPLTVSDGTLSLKQTVFDKFVQPVAQSDQALAAGRPLDNSPPMSAIFFGPPGTSKTELSRLIAEFLGWPRLTVDPSHFVRRGLDKIQAEADRIFSMLAITERVVVLLDEFDEMVRDRGQASEVLSRFLTTAMLPKLATINKQHRIVFIVATNYIEQFDLAISRPGRFDIIAQVMPPTAQAKLEHWSNLAEHIVALGVETRDIQDKLAVLTYDECEQVVPRLVATQTKPEFIGVVSDAYRSCTLGQRVTSHPTPDAQNWMQASQEQANRVRLG